MGALSGAVSLDAVVTELRRRDRITMELAGKLHEVEGIARRVREGDEPRASDADALRSAVRLMESAVAAPATVPEPLPDEVSELEEAGEEVEAEGGRSGAPTAAIVVFVVLLGLAGWMLVQSVSGTRARDEAVAAFRAGDLAVARTEFEEILAESPDDVTALLYLARIHRREARPDEAAAALRAAVGYAPGDADVRRELGWLFMDLGRPESAVEQFRLARDAAPDHSGNWVGLVLALRESNDPSAAEVLRQAPPDVQARLVPAAR